MEKINCLLSAAAVICNEGYKECGGSNILPRRKMDVECAMGKRKCRADAREGVGLASDTSEGQPIEELVSEGRRYLGGLEK